MAVDLMRIRDQFLVKAKELGLKVEEKPPAKGYQFSADLYAGEERIGRLYVRKTTVSWKAAGASKVTRITGAEGVDKALRPVQKKLAEVTAKKPIEKRAAVKAAPPPPTERKKPAAPDVTTGEPEKPAAVPIVPSGEEAAPAPPKSPTSLSRAMAAFKEGKFDKARQWAKVCLAENPDSHAAKDIFDRSQRLLEEQAKTVVGEKDDSSPKEGEDKRKPPALLRERPPIPPRESPKPAERPLVPQEPTRVQKPLEPPREDTPPKPPKSEVAVSKRPQPSTSRLRIPLWAIVAFVGLITAIIYFWPREVEHVRVRGSSDTEASISDSTADPIDMLRGRARTLELEMEGDTTGTPAGELISVLAEIAKTEPTDSTVLRRIHELIERADSLADCNKVQNRFSSAAMFLDEARSGLEALREVGGTDSVLVVRRAENDLRRDILKTRRELFEDLIPVQGGPFIRGFDRGEFDARPSVEVVLSSFYIGAHEITNREYRAYLLDTDRSGPTGRGASQRAYAWNGTEYPEGKEDHPVVLVTWQDAKRFAQWAGMDLPTEAQWEKAARGSDGRHYPWGNQFDLERAVSRESKAKLSPVGSRPGDVSPCGATDMAGNVREWVQDWFGSEYYRSRSSKGPDPSGPERGRFRVARGGSWRTDAVVAGLTHARGNLSPQSKDTALGFRLALPDSLFPEGLRTE